MSRKNIVDIFELSPLQHGMLFHTIKHPHTGVYVVQFTCEITGDLNIPVMKTAWQNIIERHPILRTAFFWEEADKPLQVVYQQVDNPVTEYDWRHLTANEQTEKLNAFLQEDKTKGFTLSKPSLMRLAFFRLADDKYHMVWTYHHLLLDGWSFGQVSRELFIYYEIILADESYPFPPTQSLRHYIDWLQQQDQEKAKQFWQQKLGDMMAPTPLTFRDATTPAQDTDDIAVAYADISLSAELTTQLQQIVKENQLTLNILSMAVWGLLLHRYTDEQDITFGVVVSGRPPDLANVETTAGAFINTLPLRLHIDPQQTTLDWLQQLQTEFLDMREFEYSALVDIQGQSSVPRGTPLFKTSFVFENYPLEDSLQDDRLSIKLDNVQNAEKTNFPLSLLVLPSDKLILKIVYDQQSFYSETADRMLGHLKMLLTSIVNNINQPLATLSLLTAAEEKQLLYKWNQTEAEYDAQPIENLFAQQVEKTPEQIALTFEEQTISYASLNKQANRLAHYLIDKGVQPQTPVAIYLERSPDMIVAMLAVLKAGGCYVPLDPTHMQPRLQFIFDDADIPFTITHSKLQDDINSLPTTAIKVDTDKLSIAPYPTHNPETPTTIDDIAYIIYTSGTTGKPKGTLVPHDGVANLATIHKNLLHINTDSNVLQFASCSFDGSVWEIWPTLCNGATLHLASWETVVAIPKLTNLMQQRKINMATLPPSVLRLADSAALPELTTLFSAGEACSADIVATWAPNRRFFNGYGPTETTVGLTFAELTADDSLIPIGQPFPNKQVFVVDSLLRPVPIGVPGELCAGGNGLAHGYLNQPQLTNEKFISPPFELQGIDRLYRTGDRVRYLENGDLVFLGRIDNQVKLRGFRIELGEIESRLEMHADVTAAVVIIYEPTPNNKQLVAYYQPQPNKTVTAKTLKTYLEADLPRYMLPSIFVEVTEFKQTPQGKIDRRDLPTPQAERERHDLIMPRNDTEKKIMAVWQEVLSLTEMSIDDNFFDLGGHSLLMMQVNRKLNKALSTNIDIIDQFQYPTIQSLAQFLDQGEKKDIKVEIQSRMDKQREALQKRRQQMKRRQR